MIVPRISHGSNFAKIRRRKVKIIRIITDYIVPRIPPLSKKKVEAQAKSGKDKFEVVPTLRGYWISWRQTRSRCH